MTLFLISCIVNAQSKLPACQGKDEKNYNNCYGTFTSPTNKYVGEWKNGNFNGQGTMTWSNGTKYVGQWKDDAHEGQGTKTWSNGEKQVGNWHKDKSHGYGTLYINGKVRFQGEFVDGFFADNNCGMRIKRKYELVTIDKYTKQENGRKITSIKNLADYKLGSNQLNPILPKYGANNVYLFNVIFDVIQNGRLVDREIRAFACIVNLNDDIVGIEREK